MQSTSTYNSLTGNSYWCLPLMNINAYAFQAQAFAKVNSSYTVKCASPRNKHVHVNCAFPRNIIIFWSTS